MTTDFDTPIVLNKIALQHDQVVDGALEICAVAKLAVLRAVQVRFTRLRVLVRCKNADRVPARSGYQVIESCSRQRMCSADMTV